MIRPQPSTRTKSKILNGRDTTTGGSIIMPIDSSADDTTMSMIRNGMKTMNPMRNAVFSSLTMKPGITT